MARDCGNGSDKTSESEEPMATKTESELRLFISVLPYQTRTREDEQKTRKKKETCRRGTSEGREKRTRFSEDELSEINLFSNTRGTRLKREAQRAHLRVQRRRRRTRKEIERRFT